MSTAAINLTDRAREVLASADALDRLLDTDETGAVCGLSPRTLRTWRTDGSGKGPAFVRVGGAIRYRASDVQTWISRLT
ncbi:helix-turn-helix transcriptional regulator [Gordonia sp. HS-NH1]|uniref:helix-turn-helix transcriptional regulator n=1 Tax=Gordonia sp. HS-NH1 TaxID=1435068 RepID=UPI0009FD1ADC|nr:helix-turn-helix domain-containing protein [Gordonia sp. HS-NH1]